MAKDTRKGSLVLLRPSGGFQKVAPRHNHGVKVQVFSEKEEEKIRRRKKKSFGEEPGRIETEFAHISTSIIVKKILTYHDPSPAIIPREHDDKETPVPDWLSAEDINYFVKKFDKSGFTGGLNYYRALDLNWELTAPWSGLQIKAPVKFIVGDEDLAYHFLGAQDFIHKGGFNKWCPLLEDVVVMNGVGHFINQERPQEITHHIHDFFNKFSSS